VPAFGKGTVNIGARQDGRLRAASVVDCAAERGAIAQAIAQVLTPAFRAAITGQANPYGDGGASARTVAAIEDWLAVCAAPGPKRFHDLPGTESLS
jgi:GDP/UDP-N,N'-diacetylbacillosamine 2-epimerase (hydrolysing)